MKLGIAGNGMIVKEVLSFIKEIGFDEIYICGRKKSEDKLLSLADSFGINRVYVDYDEMLKTDIDAVYIGLVNDMHVEYAVKAIRAKKHVICEKPVTCSLSDLEMLDSLAEKNGVFLLEAMSIYHMPAYKQLKKDIELLGDLKICNFNYSQMSSRYKTFKEGKVLPPAFDPAHKGGALRDLNVYNISAMIGLFGEPHETSYIANIEKGIDTSGILIADYDNFKCVCTAAKDCAAPGPSTIQGTDATVAIYPNVNGMTRYSVIYNDSNIEDKNVDMTDGKNRLYHEFKEFKRIIEESDKDAADEIMSCSKKVVSVLEKACV